MAELEFQNTTQSTPVVAPSLVTPEEITAEKERFPELTDIAAEGNVAMRKGEDQTPSIITTDKAKETVAKDSAKLDQMTGKNISQLSKEQKAGLPGYDQNGNPLPGYKFDVFGNVVGNPTDTTDTEMAAALEADMTPEEKELRDASQAYQNQLDDFTNQLDESAKRADEMTNSLIQNIKDQYESRKREMATINKNVLGAQKLLGARSGRLRYASEIQSSIISAEESAGINRLSALDSEMNSLILQAEMAREDKQYALLNDKMTLLTTKYQEKRQLIQDIYQLQREQNEALATKAKEAREELKFVQEQSQLYGDALAASLISYDQDGNLIPPDAETISAISRDYGFDANLFAGSINNKINELSQMDATAAKNELEVMKLQKELAYEGMTNDLKEYSYAKSEGFTGNFMDYLATKEQETVKPPSSYVEWQFAGGQEGTGKSYAEFIGGQQGLPNTVINQIDKISSSFDSAPITKQFNEVLNKKISVDSIIDGGVGGPRDLALVFEFMKALDPTSVVRESEYESAAKSGNIFSGVYAKFNGYLREEGGFLPEKVKQEFQSIISSKFDVIEKQYENLRSEKARLINQKTGSTDGSNYLIDYNIDFKPTKTLQDFYSSNPELQGQVEQMILDNPELTDDDIMNILYYDESDFNNVGGDTNTAVNAAEAIGQFESGGNYSARGPVVTSGMYKGEQAAGKYQIMPGNIPQWSKEALGYSVSLDEFLSSPELQDKIAQYKIGKLMNQYGNIEDVASVWFSGRPLAKAGNAKDVIGTTVPNYVKNVSSIYNRLI